ncbi:MAG: alpha/beta hydrolase [Thermoactinomyces sp.]
MKKTVKLLFIVVVAVFSVCLIAAAGYIVNNLYYHKWDMKKVWKAGFHEKQVSINGSTLNYVEGPDNGPPLLLIHGQVMNWENYARVLPALSREFHVYAVDCYGHGGSSHDASKYSMSKTGKDLSGFVDKVIREPVIVSGHSSGGLLAAWLAANSPEHVSGVVLEDPPFFSSEFPRAKKTFNYVDLSVLCHEFLQSDEKDFTAWYVKHNTWMRFFQAGESGLRKYGLDYRKKHPRQPLVYFFLPPSMNQLFQPLDQYDPRFGEAFYDGSWNDQDHEEMLAKIEIPSVLIHTNWQYDQNGILLGAMDGKDASRAYQLLKNSERIRVDSGHGFHFEKPEEFIKILLEFKIKRGLNES